MIFLLHLTKWNLPMNRAGAAPVKLALIFHNFTLHVLIEAWRTEMSFRYEWDEFTKHNQSNKNGSIGKEQIIGCHSKVLPDACKRYSVSELELFGLLINISAFKHLLKGWEFAAYVDHSWIVQILKSKEEPCTTRLQKLIFKLSEYAFKLGYKKGTDIVLADFLSRAPCDNHSEIDRVVILIACLFTEDWPNGHAYS